MKTVLVIEDRKSWQVRFERMLKKAGYKVTIATTYAEGVKKLKRKKSGVAVVDISLVYGDRLNRDGWNLAKNHAYIPVIIVSAYLSKREVSKLHREEITKWYCDKHDFDKAEFLVFIEEAFKKFGKKKGVDSALARLIEKQFRLGD